MTGALWLLKSTAKPNTPYTSRKIHWNGPYHMWVPSYKFVWLPVKGLIINFCLTVRLRDEEKVCQLVTMLQEYLEVNGSRSEICRVYLRHIEHLYYKVNVNKITDKYDQIASYIYSVLSSFEWSHFRILSTYKNVRTTFYGIINTTTGK